MNKLFQTNLLPTLSQWQTKSLMWKWLYLIKNSPPPPLCLLEMLHLPASRKVWKGIQAANHKEFSQHQNRNWLQRAININSSLHVLLRLRISIFLWIVKRQRKALQSWHLESSQILILALWFSLQLNSRIRFSLQRQETPWLHISINVSWLKMITKVETKTV